MLFHKPSQAQIMYYNSMCILNFFFSPEKNSGTPWQSANTQLFSASTSFAVTPSSIDTLSDIIKPTETITIGKMLLKIQNVLTNSCAA